MMKNLLEKFLGSGPRPTDESCLPEAAYPSPPASTTRLPKNFGLDKSAKRLPIASDATVNQEMRTLLWSHKAGFFAVAALQLCATAAALIPPRYFGGMLERLQQGGDPGVEETVVIVAFALMVQALFVYFTKVRAAILGEFVLSTLRERFLIRVLQLPPHVVEKAGSGELLTRTTTDINHITWAVRDAVPVITICLVSILGITGAIALTAPLFLSAVFIGIPFVFAATRWYLRRSPQAYRIESSSWAIANGVLVETAESGRTIESFRLEENRIKKADASISRWIEWERYTLSLRSRWFPAVELNYILPVSAALFFGWYFYQSGNASIATITAGILYAQMLAGPIEAMLWWIDELQSGKASLSRLLGVNEVEERQVREGEPVDRQIAGEKIRFGYRENRDVLKDISFLITAGTKLAIVGPSGAGKSTLGRLLAGVTPPTSGSLTIGGAEIGYMKVEDARSNVALVTQEHHVFVGSLRENITLAKADASDQEVWRAIEAVGGRDWVEKLAENIHTRIGSGGHRLLPAQAQQLALARLLLADPHTLILDEATSLLDQRAAKELESSLNAVLAGRTVIAIAHRLQTAHDADIIAVIDDGKITEWGSHIELIARDGQYAKLWNSWRDEHSS
jgi:ABC-type multidrug transport system fused ATPase/permease subunit